MAFEWDEDNRKAHLAKHGVDFRRMTALFDGPTNETVDDRTDYGETRINALGEIDGEPTSWPTPGAAPISARKANDREQRKYHARHPR